MLDLLDRIVETVLHKMRNVPSTPSQSVLQQLLETTYLATLRTEEGKPIRGAIVFADASKPDSNLPIRRRADYPDFTAFEQSLDFNVGTLVKLSRAIDSWAGAIAVHGTRQSNIQVWGVLDQVVHRNIRLHHESTSGYRMPGILSIHMEGIAAFSVYHGDLFLARLQQDRIILHENDAFDSAQVTRWLTPIFKPIASQIALAIDKPKSVPRIQSELLRVWSSSVSRICIGLRRLQTGGAFLFTPAPGVHPVMWTIS